MIIIKINNNDTENHGQVLTTVSGKWQDCFAEYLALIKHKQEIINDIGIDLLNKVEIIKK